MVPANIMRVRTQLPEGYEVSELAGPTSPITSWGLGPQWAAEPAACAALGDPGRDALTRGWSASGPGGIVYAVVADAPVALDGGVVAACSRWTVTAGHTSAAVATGPGPVIAATPTVGMAVDATTVVEGGTETHSRADTFVAYLGGHVAHVTVVTDPGADGPTLSGDFAAGLLVDAVSALRS